MKTLRLTRAESTAYTNGERRFWRAMRKQPLTWNTVKREPFTLPDEPLIWSPLASHAEDRRCPYGKPGDLIRLRRERGEPDWHCITPEITAITVEQRGGRWGWVVEVGA